jgi:hypothetical protein
MKTYRSRDYSALRDHLIRQVDRIVLLTFDEIAKIIGDSLPDSAINRDQWWGASSRHTHAQKWEESGYKAINRGTNRSKKRMEFERQ